MILTNDVLDAMLDAEFQYLEYLEWVNNQVNNLG